MILNGRAFYPNGPQALEGRGHDGLTQERVETANPRATVSPTPPSPGSRGSRSGLESRWSVNGGHPEAQTGSTTILPPRHLVIAMGATGQVRSRAMHELAEELLNLYAMATGWGWTNSCQPKPPSIHKSQGSEYPVAAVLLVIRHDAMAASDLLYSGVTCLPTGSLTTPGASECGRERP